MRSLGPLTTEGVLKGLRHNNSEELKPHDAGWLEDFELDNLQSLTFVSGL
jgi:hypothetical protein